MSKLSPLQLDGTCTIDFHRIRTVLSCSPSPPPSPDYAASARAQGAANVDAARVQGKINNPNVVNPYGTQTTTWDGDQPTLTQTFSPEQQALYNQSTATQQQLGKVAGQGATALEGVIGKSVDFSGAPQTGNYDATRKSVIDAMMGRANEDYAKQTDNANSNLIAAGIRPGTKAYADNQQMIERSRNDARANAEVAGGNAAAQAYGVDEARRRQSITEQLAQRQTPLNEISALMSGSQVSNPFQTPGYAQNAQVGASPLFAATQEQGDWETGLYNNQAAQAGNLQSGLFGLAGVGMKAGAAASDRRVKRQIRRIGTHPLGVGLYRFRYRPEYAAQWGHGIQIGVMADEVLRIKPEAVSTHPDGYLLVHYGQL